MRAIVLLQLDHRLNLEVAQQIFHVTDVGTAKRVDGLISIARAIYKHASLLLFDEATSALDNESEKRIQNALKNYAKDKITITIAHRLSTIEDADMILVFQAGHIVASGTHQELLENSQSYKKLAGKLEA